MANYTNDIESNINIRVPDAELRGILRTSNEQEDIANNICVKYVISILIIIMTFPIIIADLYYAYSDTSCIEYYPGELDINIRTYLIVSAFVGIANISRIKFTLCVFGILKRSPLDTIINLFELIWNIIAAIIYWGTLYNSNLCSHNIYNYLFITLIIKLVFVNYSLLTKNKEQGNPV
jgi:hypothetical protein